MTPAARVQAAIEVLSPVLSGAPAERELTRWARRSRFAGSKDRAAVRDHVFDALRRLRSSAWAGGLGDVPPSDMDARRVMAGLLQNQGIAPEDIFTGARHAPDPLGAMPEVGTPPRGVVCDMPDWLLAHFDGALGEDASPVLAALRDRAPVILRANLARIERDSLVERLRSRGLDAVAHPASPSAIKLEGAARGLATDIDYLSGLFELQDAGAQALVDRLPLAQGARILDLCAGGGGKSLAIAARASVQLWAHDAAPRRLRDLASRADRAGVEISVTNAPEDAAPFDGVVADVPCSGSGAWRRSPEARWRLSPERLSELNAVQVEILQRAIDLTVPDGWIAYMTCSLFDVENRAVVSAAIGRKATLKHEWRCTPLDGCDGFYLALLRKA